MNERVRETVTSSESAPEFVCECSNEDCIETVLLDLDEYDRIRFRANLFIVAAGHELPEVERIIDQGEGYVLVEKTVDVRRVKASNPRSRDT